MLDPGLPPQAKIPGTAGRKDVSPEEGAGDYQGVFEPGHVGEGCARKC